MQKHLVNGAATMALLLGVASQFAFLGSAPAQLAPAACAGNPSALGTSRVLEVTAATTPRVGRKQFPETLPLEKKEVVLTFDDGPHPGTTEAVLDVLRRECVRASFFLIGRNAAAHADLAWREVAEGHTVGSHSYGHPLLDHLDEAAAVAEIDHGFAALTAALQGRRSERQVAPAPFFRFPGFASTPALLARLEARNVAVFGADFWASDWNRMEPKVELRLLMTRVASAGGGIVLLHDTKQQTAAMLPDFLQALKTEGYRVVHVVAGGVQRGPQNDHGAAIEN